MFCDTKSVVAITVKYVRRMCRLDGLLVQGIEPLTKR